ncbi:hypothetical protein SBADM41S_02826 [Streptomyces badius]
MSPADDTTYEIRTATPEDTGLVEALDGSFTTATVFRVEMAENGFTLRETPVDPPLTKVFPEDEDAEAQEDRVEEGHLTFLALAPDGSLAGFVSVSYARWNRRLTVEDIEVAPGHRGRGVGGALMSRAEEFARERGAAGHICRCDGHRRASDRPPRIQAYRRSRLLALLGWTTSGVYEVAASACEYALYLGQARARLEAYPRPPPEAGLPGAPRPPSLVHRASVPPACHVAGGACRSHSAGGGNGWTFTVQTSPAPVTRGSGSAEAGLTRLSPALSSADGSCSSAVVRRRARLSVDAGVYGLKRAVGFRGFQL